MIKALIFFVVFVSGCLSGLTVRGQNAQEFDENKLIRYARIAIAQTLDENRRFDNLLYKTVVGQSSVLNGRNNAKYRRYTFESELLSENEIKSLRKMAREWYPESHYWIREIEKSTPDNKIAKEKAAKDFWEWTNLNKRPDLTRFQIVWSHFGMFGPEYFFSDSFIGKEVNLSEGQLESVRKARRSFLEKLDRQTREIEEMAYDKILGELSSTQQARLYSKFDEKHFFSLLTMDRLTRSRFQRNVSTEGLVPLDWEERSLENFPHNYFGIFPSCLLEGDWSLGCCVEVDEYNSKITKSLNDGRFYTLLGPLFLLQSEYGYGFDEDVLKEMGETNDKSVSFDVRRERYNRRYSELLSKVENEHVAFVLGSEVLRRGLVSFLVEPSIVEWLRYEDDQVQKIVDTAKLVKKDTILLRQGLINASVQEMFDALTSEQQKRLEEMFGLSVAELVTIFQSCSDAELRILFGDARPKFSTEKYVNPADSLGMWHEKTRVCLKTLGEHLLARLVRRFSDSLYAEYF